LSAAFFIFFAGLSIYFFLPFYVTEFESAAAQIAEWLAVAWNGPAYDVLAGVCFCSGREWPCSGAANVASKNDEFQEPRRIRAHPAGGVAEDASACAMIAGLAFPIVYPLLAVLQACTDINASTT